MTPKQLRFVDEYLVDLNAAAAARRAGYSAAVANRQGAENLSKPVIATAIAEAQRQRSVRTKIDADAVLQRLVAMLDADLADLYAAGDLLPVAEWPEVWRRGLVAGLETVRESTGRDSPPLTVRKVKLADRLKVLELIGRHVDVQAWRDRAELTGRNGAALVPPVSVQLTPPRYAAMLEAVLAKVAA